MSNTALARYHFLAWTRRGVATSINQPDQGELPSRASLSVQLAISSLQGTTTTITNADPKTVEIFGPGDVIGIDPRHIIRTEPRNFTTNYEPNYLCGIEFDSSDLPWLFTPATPVGDRLRPWVALIALKSDEFTFVTTPPNPLPAIQITTLTPLNELTDSWNWAHAQISGDTPIADAMSSAPGTVISRLLCPRRLDPETGYTAFLVPAFEIGRQAGLGQDISTVTHSDPAWTIAKGPNQTAVPLTLPYYYQFQFHTSDAGDFESLVRALTPTVLTDGVGSRLMDVAHAEEGIPSAGPPLGLEGALRSVSTTSTDWKDPDKTAFQTSVQTFINQPSALVDDPANPIPDDPVIAPPIYGRWHAAVQSVDRTAAGWVNDLNLDPRNRAAGGMGTQVIQKELTQVLASAWQQVDGVLAANQKLRQAQLARAALQQIYAQHFQIMQPDTALLLTAPLHSRLMASPITIRATIRASRVPERMLSPVFRRVTRPVRRLTPAVSSSATPSIAAKPSILSRVNSGELTIVPAPKPPDGMVSIDQISDQIASTSDQSLAKNWKLWLILIIIAAIVLAIIAGFTIGLAAAVAVAAAGAVAAVALWNKAKAAIANVALSNELHVSGFTPQMIVSIPQNTSFQVVAAGVAPPITSTGTADTAAAAQFRSVTSDLFTYVQALPIDAPQAPPLDLVSLKTTLMLRLNPAITVPQRINSLINLSTLVPWKPLDPIAPIMAAPSFTQPMYAPLRDLDQQYVLPGVDLVPQNSVGLVISNHAFIEAYMVGLNHEMARQLLWNDYPTDQRGSYFRQFWDVSSYVPEPGDPTDPTALSELLKDIPPINTWPLTVPLGDHPNRTDVPLDNVVLLVRGEIFKRYPNAVVFAAKAIRTGNTLDIDESDDSAYKYHIFRGELSDDITFLGFNLSKEDARGGTTDAPYGYFFVFQQQPSEPRFGLEPTEATNPTTLWADLAWTNFGPAPAGGGIYQLPDLGLSTRAMIIKKNPWRLSSQVFNFVVSNNAVPDILSPSISPARTAIAADANNPNDPNNKWGVNSAQTAYILLRLPFRVLIHADLMLPTQ
ncbi:hypothetical protein [Tunturiibacter lichenicola]|uniref:hypothetical protein n=1 Tax=Tunturiibacter lichenicola TaxID=2051959 RepID=UPI003D9B5047